MKKVIALCVTIFILASATVGGVFAYNSIIKPKLVLRDRIDALVNSTYEYDADIHISGVSIGTMDKEFDLSVTGTKGEEVIYGRLSHEVFDYMDVYVDEDYNMIFNAKPFIDSMIDTAGDKMDVSLGLLTAFVSDMYVSLDQFEYIIGKDILTVSDAGISSEVFEGISKTGEIKKLGYVLMPSKEPYAKSDKLDKDAMYFSFKHKESGTILVIGIPENEEDNNIWCYVEKDGTSWEVYMEYAPEDDKGIEMPEETFSDDQLEFIKEIYSYWEDSKKESESDK